MAILKNPYTGDNLPDDWDAPYHETLEDFLATQENDDGTSTRSEQQTGAEDLPIRGPQDHAGPHSREQHPAP